MSDTSANVVMTFIIDLAQWGLIWYLIRHRRPPILNVTVQLVGPSGGGTPITLEEVPAETPAEDDDAGQVLH